MVAEATPPARRYWPRLMRESEAADYLSIGTTTLREKGPEPKHIGRSVRYDINDLDRWADRLDGQPLAPEQIEEETDAVTRRWLEKRKNGRG